MKRVVFPILLGFLSALVHANALADDRALIAKEWKSYVKSLEPIGEQVAELLSDPGDPQLREEMYSMMFSEIAAGYIGLVYANPEHPDFWPDQNQVFNNIAVSNPDNVYYDTPIDDNGIYRISGFRGTVHLVNFQIGTNSVLSRGEGSFGPTLANYDLDDGVHIDKDGAFDVILSRTRPKDYKGDWWPLLKGATYLLVRQSAYDWIHETDARIAIDRLDTPAAKPRPTAATIRTNLKQIPVWVRNYMTLAMEGPRRLKKRGYKRGIILGRWERCETPPVATIKKVDVTEVRKYLPADTPMVTAEAREGEVRLRRKGAQLRRRW